MKNIPAVIVAVALGALVPAPASANVSLKNGNFFIGYTDAIYSGGFGLKVERVYNSKTAFKGLFGWGWGMDYEVYVEPTGDGSVIVHEYGGGAENIFSPAAPDPTILEIAIQSITRAAVRNRNIPASDTAPFKRRLATDPTFRNDEWMKYVKSGDVQPRRLAAGTQLRSDRFAKQIVTRTATGYERVFETGRVELFDDLGHLVKVSDSNNNTLALTYDPAGKLSTITDNLGHTLRFSINPRGLITSVRMDNGHTAAYRYDEQSNLIWTRDVDGNEYTHSYDARHNMIEIGYQDHTTLKITYHPLSLQENVKSVKDRDGTLTTYDYKTTQTEPEILRVTVSVYAAGQEKTPRARISESVYEYHMFPSDKYHAEQVERLITVIDGDSTETVYNRCCALPTRITSGSDTTKFAYDTDGHITYKESTSSIDSLAYSPSAAKPTRVVHIDKSSMSSHWAEFAYDPKGNLITAHDSDDQRVDLTYDNVGRIATLTDTSGVISFTYNKDSKPTEIKHSKLGSILVTYDSRGEVEKTDSPGGSAVGRQIVNAFQRLLDLIRPAGVTLGL
jgi:YD repeat-containing protein